LLQAVEHIGFVFQPYNHDADDRRAEGVDRWDFIGRRSLIRYLQEEDRG
jgi:hypothetical protein